MSEIIVTTRITRKYLLHKTKWDLASMVLDYADNNQKVWDENDTLRAENEQIKKEAKVFFDAGMEYKAERDSLLKQLELAKDIMERAANYVGGDYDDESDADRMDGTEKMLTEGLAQLYRISIGAEDV
jgi:hypothetical protein